MKAGIVGLPNVGKSTLFNCLSNTKAQSANFPFCTIEPNIGIINVPDKRLNLLESYVDPEKVIPANVEIVDIAGLVKGASKGEGLGNQFLANIRETDAIIHVLRCFDDNNIVHVEESINPVRDKEIIDLELQLKDLETIEKRKEKISRLIKTGNKDAIFQNEVLIKIITHLQSFQPVRSIDFTEKQKEFSETISIGISGHMHGATIIDNSGSVIRPCILWNDTRSHKECIEFENQSHDVRAISGNITMPGFTAPKINWLKKNERENYRI